MTLENSRHRLSVSIPESVPVEACQVCNSRRLEPVFFAGYLPPVNTMPNVGEVPREQISYPAQLLQCLDCQLFQLGLIVSPKILFPPTYPYTSGTTKILRDNFSELALEVAKLYPLQASHLVVDIGSNDGTLLSNFTEHRVLGIEPTNAAKLAERIGIKTVMEFFTRDLAVRVAAKEGKARLVTATNCFAHIDDIHSIVEGVLELMEPDGLFVTESHYLLSLIETVQYDTIYHEHLRYYTVTSLEYLLGRHGLTPVHVKRIPTHGGSIRVYAARKGRHKVHPSVARQMDKEREGITPENLRRFRKRIVHSKLQLHALLARIKDSGGRVFGVGAPSRASTLINYVGLDDGILDCVLEVEGSHKIGKYVPGTRIPVLNEATLFEEQPEYALLLSWHIAPELIPKLVAKGFRGDFIVPLPEPEIISGKAQRKAG